MVYSEELHARIMAHASGWPNADSNKMFGGVCYLMNGNMVCGVTGDSLILRLGEAEADRALGQPSIEFRRRRRQPAAGTRYCGTVPGYGDPAT